MAKEFKARPTVYKGVEMRSRLEAGFARFLDDHSATWQYEPMAFAGSSGQYLPDFFVPNFRHFMYGSDEPFGTFFEVKPTIESTKGVMTTMEVVFESKPNCAVVVVCQESQLCQIGFPNVYFGKNDGPRSWRYYATFAYSGPPDENFNGTICLVSPVIAAFEGEWWKK